MLMVTQRPDRQDTSYQSSQDGGDYIQPVATEWKRVIEAPVGEFQADKNWAWSITIRPGKVIKIGEAAGSPRTYGEITTGPKTELQKMKTRQVVQTVRLTAAEHPSCFRINAFFPDTTDPEGFGQSTIRLGVLGGIIPGLFQWSG